jgi:hypothetical protein
MSDSNGGAVVVSAQRVTPEIASRWLGTGSVGQRPLNKAHVVRLAAEMVAGRWVLNNDAVCFDRAGQVINGQHRLSAVVASGATVPMMVATGMEAKAFAHMDRPRIRAGGDMVAMAGGKNAILAAAITSAVVRYEQGAIRAGGWERLSLAETHAEYVARRNDIDAAARIARGIPRALGFGPSIIGAAYYILAKADAVRGPAFMESLLTGTGAELAARDLRESIIQRGKNSRRQPYEQLAVIIKQWNKRDHGNRVMNAYYRGTGDRAEPFPVAK